MEKNMGLADRIIRVLIAATIAILYFASYISGTTAIVLGIVVLLFVATSFISVCPLYSVFGWSTRKK